jgi:hypothetical protein
MFCSRFSVLRTPSILMSSALMTAMGLVLSTFCCSGMREPVTSIFTAGGVACANAKGAAIIAMANSVATTHDFRVNSGCFLLLC